MIFLMMLDDKKYCQRFQDIYDNYKNQMWYTANSLLHDEFFAEDAVHDAFFGIAKNFSKIKSFDEKAIRSYVLTAAYRAALAYIRKEKRAGEIINLENAWSLKDRKSDYEFDKIEMSDLAYSIIKNMPDTYRDVMYFHFVLGLNEREISDQLGKNINTVRQQISRGRKMFIDKFQKEENRHE